jgi:hypothetical protein
MHQNLEALKMIVPATLTHIKTFESRYIYALMSDDSWVRDEDESTASLELQCSEWVQKTNNLIVNLGSLSVQEYDSEGRKEILRTIAVTFAAPVEQGNRNDTQSKKPEERKPDEPVGDVGSQTESGSVTSAVALSDGASSSSKGRSPLRVPSVD